MAVTGGRCSMYFPFPERKLDLAAVSSPTASFLIIAASRRRSSGSRDPTDFPRHRSRRRGQSRPRRRRDPESKAAPSADRRQARLRFAEGLGHRVCRAQRRGTPVLHLRALGID